MFKIIFLLCILGFVSSFEHLLEGSNSIKVDEIEFNKRKTLHPKLLLMIWDNSRVEVVSELQNWKKLTTLLPPDIIPLHFERDEHNKITERILPKSFPAYIFIENEHFAYEFVSENKEVENVLEFANGGYKLFPKEHIPHSYDFKKKYKKSWPKLLTLLFFVIFTFVGICCCFKYKNQIEDEDEPQMRKYKIN